MRGILLVCALPALVTLGCGDDGTTTPGRDMAMQAMDMSAMVSPADMAHAVDLAELPDESPPDLIPGCTTQRLLDGQSSLAAQGWTVSGTASAVVTDGVVVEFKTTGLPMSTTSAQVLVSKLVGIATGSAYSLQWRLKVSTTNNHNPLDAPAAFMPSLTGAAGSQTDRSEMIYFDSAAIGWSDDSQSYAVDTSIFHVYRLDVSSAGHAEVRVDGTLALSRDNFTTTGLVAIGDQTNDANFDATFELYQLDKLCP